MLIILRKRHSFWSCKRVKSRILDRASKYQAIWPFTIGLFESSRGKWTFYLVSHFYSSLDGNVTLQLSQKFDTFCFQVKRKRVSDLGSCNLDNLLSNPDSQAILEILRKGGDFNILMGHALRAKKVSRLLNELGLKGGKILFETCSIPSLKVCHFSYKDGHA